MIHRPLVFLDIETTGSSAQNSRVLEIGAIRVEQGRQNSVYSQLLFPQEFVPSFITGLTGITNDMTIGKPIFADIALELQTFLKGGIFVAHNVGFDYSFIKSEYKKLGIIFAMDRICTVRLSRILYPQQRRHNLDTIIETHNLDVTNRHRALDDAKVLFDFYKKTIEDHGLKSYAAMNKILKTAKST
jgi:DNA polymerase III subunit epsilon